MKNLEPLLFDFYIHVDYQSRTVEVNEFKVIEILEVTYTKNLIKRQKKLPILYSQTSYMT